MSCNIEADAFVWRSVILWIECRDRLVSVLVFVFDVKLVFNTFDVSFDEANVIGTSPTVV